MTDKPVQWGLIGFGAWGQCHAGAIDGCGDAELAAVTVRSEASQAAAREKFPNAKVYSDVAEMLANEQLDVVDIVVPSHLHHEFAAQVLENGTHLLLEKPMTLSVSDCQSLVDLAKSANRLLAVGHELRLSSLWGRVRDIITEGTIGTPQYGLVELSRRPYRLGADGWRFDIERVGNWILEEPIHFFDLARWYLSDGGHPKSIYATANSRQPGHPELQDNFSAIMQFDGGAYAVVSQTLSAFEHHQMAKVAGTDGAIWATWSGAMDRTRHPTFSLRVFDGQDVVTEELTKTTGELFELEDQVQMMCDAIRGNGTIAATGEDGLWSVAMCVAAQKSVESGQPVAISDASA